MNNALLSASWYGLAPGTVGTESLFAVCLILAVVVALVGVVSTAQRPRVKADKHTDAEGNAKVFTLSLSGETVTLDHLGHLMIGCVQGAERMETGLRGLSTIIQNGAMLKPASLHVDPLQRGVEI